MASRCSNPYKDYCDPAANYPTEVGGATGYQNGTQTGTKVVAECGLRGQCVAVDVPAGKTVANSERKTGACLVRNCSGRESCCGRRGHKYELHCVAATSALCFSGHSWIARWQSNAASLTIVLLRPPLHPHTPFGCLEIRP